MNHQDRLKRLQQFLPGHKLDFLLITHPPNVRYLCGFTGSAGALLITPKTAIFFTDGRYTSQAKEEVQKARVSVAARPPLVAAAEWLASRNKGGPTAALGIEGEHLTVAERGRLHALVSPRVRLKAAPPLVERARMVKDQDEVERIRDAVLLGASLFDAALKAIRPGVREVEVAAEMEYEARRRGAEQMSFETIIASGERSALPHGRASEAAIREGFVVCDFGVILAGYCSDMTRTVYVGRPSDEARRLYAAVKDSQQAAVAAIKPGVSAGDVDRAARKVLGRHGLAKFFVHSTGHGVGLEIHEAPRIAARQDEILHPGMVITIEPGAYVPGNWGVRIEDMVVVTESGCEILTPTSKELILL